MSKETCEVVPHIPDISVEDLLISGARAEESTLAPVKRSDSALVAEHSANEFAFISIPDLNDPTVSANREMGAPFGPGHSSD